jgi:hypothetical protein
MAIAGSNPLSSICLFCFPDRMCPNEPSCGEIKSAPANVVFWALRIQANRTFKPGTAYRPSVRAPSGSCLPAQESRSCSRRRGPWRPLLLNRPAIKLIKYN